MASSSRIATLHENELASIYVVYVDVSMYRYIHVYIYICIDFYIYRFYIFHICVRRWTSARVDVGEERSREKYKKEKNSDRERD